MEHINNFVVDFTNKIPSVYIEYTTTFINYLSSLIYYQLTLVLFFILSTIKWSFKLTMKIFATLLIHPLIIAWNIFELFYKTIVLPIFYFSIVAGVMGIVAGIIVGGFALLIDSLLPSGIERNRITYPSNRLNSQANYEEIEGVLIKGGNELRRKREERDQAKGDIMREERIRMRNERKTKDHNIPEIAVHDIEDELNGLNKLKRMRELREIREAKRIVGELKEMQKNREPSQTDSDSESSVILTDDNNTTTEDDNSIISKSPLDSPPESPIEAEAAIFEQQPIKFNNGLHKATPPLLLSTPKKQVILTPSKIYINSNINKTPTNPPSSIRKPTPVSSTINNYTIAPANKGSLPASPISPKRKVKILNPKAQTVTFPGTSTTTATAPTLGHYEDEDGYFNTSAYASPARRYSEGTITEEDEDDLDPTHNSSLPRLSSTNGLSQKKWNRVAETVWKDIKTASASSSPNKKSSPRTVELAG